jgi:hypothetical protein
MNEGSLDFPALLQVEYPDRDLNPLTTFFRPLTVIPIAVILGLLSGPSMHANEEDYSFAAMGVVFLPTALMILFRQKYPRWWFDWNLELTRLTIRVASYLALLRDEYPSTDEEQAVYLDLAYPDAKDLNRWLPLVKWLLAIPHYLTLAFLAVAAVFGVIYAWIAILVTGRYPRPIFDFIVGVFRWWLRVMAYAFLLTTDRYPPFRLSE